MSVWAGTSIAQPSIGKHSLLWTRKVKGCDPGLKQRQIEGWCLYFEHAQYIVPFGIIMHAIRV